MRGRFIRQFLVEGAGQGALNDKLHFGLDKTIQLFEKYIELRKVVNDSTIWHHYGICLRKIGRHADAELALMKSLGLDRTDPETELTGDPKNMIAVSLGALHADIWSG